MGIRTQTSASSLDQLVFPGDLTVETSVLNPSTKQAQGNFEKKRYSVINSNSDGLRFCVLKKKVFSLTSWHQLGD